MMLKKQCSECGQVKPAHEFFRCGRGKNGLRSNCKKCCYAYYEKRRVENSPIKEYVPQPIPLLRPDKKFTRPLTVTLYDTEAIPSGAESTRTIKS